MEEETCWKSGGRRMLTNHGTSLHLLLSFASSLMKREPHSSHSSVYFKMPNSKHDIKVL